MSTPPRAIRDRDIDIIDDRMTSRGRRYAA
jgi:hypothetical protein